MAIIMPSAHEVSPVLEELNHDGPTLAIGSEAILSRDDRERATESAFHLARDRRNARASVQASRRHGFRGSELVAEARAPSSAWRKRDLRNGPSHGGNTSGSRAYETFSKTSTGPLAVCNIATAASSSLTCLTVAVWRKPQVIATPARSTPALVW